MFSFGRSETFLFQNRKSFRTFKRKAVSEGIFWALRAQKMPSELRVFFGEVRRTNFLQKNGSPENTPLPHKILIYSFDFFVCSFMIIVDFIKLWHQKK